MPFIVTTKPGCDCGFCDDPNAYRRPCSSRRWEQRAVATLGDVHDRIGQALRDHGSEGVTVIDLMLVNESGGTVGPLPDGTVIEVSQGSTQQDMRYQLREWDVRVDTRDAGDDLIAFAWTEAYNARVSS